MQSGVLVIQNGFRRVDPLSWLAKAVSSIGSIFASCPHVNTNFDGFKQRCWDCGRTRTFATTSDPGMWHREVRR
jgi:hypothetical protein